MVYRFPMIFIKMPIIRMGHGVGMVLSLYATAAEDTWDRYQAPCRTPPMTGEMDALPREGGGNGGGKQRCVESKVVLFIERNRLIASSGNAGKRPRDD